MRIAIAGTGPVGLGCAALLASTGHEATIWSPRGTRGDAGHREIVAAGRLEARARVAVAQSVEVFTDADVILVCVSGAGHRMVFERLAAVLRSGQNVIISSHCSLGALYLTRILAERGVDARVIAWATTLIGARMVGGQVLVSMLRDELDVASVPASANDDALALCRALFPARFSPSRNLLAIALSNLNPPIHMANALLNFTRIEKGEDWDNYGGITEGVGRLVEALDAERLAIARALDVEVRTARDHYLKSTPGLTPGSVADLSSQVAAQRRPAGGTPGPKTTGTRFITEDLPFGIHPIARLGALVGARAKLHEAGIGLFNAIYACDFAAENDLLPHVRLDSLGAPALQDVVCHGWTPKTLARLAVPRR